MNVGVKRRITRAHLVSRIWIPICDWCQLSAAVSVQRFMIVRGLRWVTSASEISSGMGRKSDPLSLCCKKFSHSLIISSPPPRRRQTKKEEQSSNFVHQK